MIKKNACRCSGTTYTNPKFTLNTLRRWKTSSDRCSLLWCIWGPSCDWEYDSKLVKLNIVQGNTPASCSSCDAVLFRPQHSFILPVGYEAFWSFPGSIPTHGPFSSFFLSRHQLSYQYRHITPLAFWSGACTGAFYFESWLYFLCRHYVWLPACYRTDPVAWILMIFCQK